MRRLIILLAILVILIISGGLTAMIASSANGAADFLPVLTITADPNASSTMMQPWKAEQMFLFLGFVVTSLIGMAALLAIVFWLLDRSMQNTALKEGGIVPSAGTTIEVRNADKLPANTSGTAS